MKKIFICAVLLLPFISFAEDLPPPGLEDPPKTAVPINQIDNLLIGSAIFLGALIIFARVKKVSVK